MIPRHLQIAIVLLLIAAIGLGFYALHLKRRAEQLQQRTTDTRPIAPPVSGPTEPVTLWVAYDDQGVLRTQQVKAALPSERSDRARHVLRALLAVYLDKSSPHPIGADTDVKDVYLLGNDTLVIDMTPAFADAHRSGILVEELTMISMVQTLAANVPNITRVKFLVDGKERDTLAGHADLRQFYELGVVAKAAQELQQ